MLWHVYVRKGTAFVPTVARTQAGYYLDIEPVLAAPTADADTVCDAVKRTIAKGNPVVPTPTRAAFPKPVVLKYAGVRSWSDFEKTALLWTISWDKDRYQIRKDRRRLDRGWEEDPAQIEILPLGASLEEVAQRVSSSIQVVT